MKVRTSNAGIARQAASLVVLNVLWLAAVGLAFEAAGGRWATVECAEGCTSGTRGPFHLTHAIIGAGVVGAVLGLFLWAVWRGLESERKSRDRHASYDKGPQLSQRFRSTAL